ncbi:MAG TPA: BON domain-containing protein, partial [Dongiaceae bacterium]|nr:BON domain-containing protein [Dongiaceae bacterium]
MNTASHSLKKLSLSLLASGVLLLPAVQVSAADPATKSDSIETNAKEGWKEGMIEGAYLFNTHLSAKDIDVEVTGSTAVLKGYVATNAEKSLAEEIAQSVDGVETVNNQLSVNANKAKSESQTVDNVKSDLSDAAITAKVKSKLLANSEVKGLKINVDTANKEVTLSGTVSSDTERDLAYY